MTAHVIALIIGVAVAGFVIGTAYGAVCADFYRAAWWAVADRVLEWRGPAPVYVPVYEDYVPVADAPAVTPAEGNDWVPTARADLPVHCKPTVDHAPTGPFAAVGYVPPPASWAEPPPSMEDLRRQYDQWKQPVYGEAPQLEIEAGAHPVMMP